MIYLHKKINFLKYIFSIIFLVIFIIISGYYLSYLKYNNQKIINSAILEEENRILQSELDKIKTVNTYDSSYVIARVVLRDLHSFYNEIVINVGNDKVSVGDAVVNEEGLIGIIKETKKDFSYVSLIADGYNLSIKVADTYGNLNGQKVDLLNKYSQLKEGDLIYTSGLTTIPEGIYVGKIDKVKMDSDNLGQEVQITLVDNQDLIYVGVIKSLK